MGLSQNEPSKWLVSSWFPFETTQKEGHPQKKTQRLACTLNSRSGTRDGAPSKWSRLYKSQGRLGAAPGFEARLPARCCKSPHGLPALRAVSSPPPKGAPKAQPQNPKVLGTRRRWQANWKLRKHHMPRRTFETISALILLHACTISVLI